MSYYRKWTQMNFHYSIDMMQKYNFFKPESFYKYFQMHHPPGFQGIIPKEQLYDTTYEPLINDLFNKYPDLKYVPLDYTQAELYKPGRSIEQRHFLPAFIEKQIELMNKGYTKQKAFELVEEIYQSRIQRQVTQTNIVSNLAFNNNCRSFLNLYQQNMEYESRLKIKRMKRDLYFYQQHKDEQMKLEKQEEEDVKKVIKDQSEQFEEDNQEFDFDENQQDSQKSKNYLNQKYEKVLFKIVNNPSEKTEKLTFENRRKISAEFINRTQTLFELYYKRASILDKLDGLTDKEIILNIRTTPKKLKRASEKVIKVFTPYQISLDQNGEIIIPEQHKDNPILKKLLSNHPNIKYLLMYKELQYESALHENIQAQIDKFYHRINEIKEEQENTRLEAEAKEKFTLQDELGRDATYKSKDEKIHTTKIDNDKINQNVIEDLVKNGRIDRNKQRQAYKFFETQAERHLRIEIKWLRSKIELLKKQSGEKDEGQSHIQIDEKINKVKDLVFKLRRLKFKIEQEAVKNAQELIFDEHQILVNDKDTFLADSEIKYEDLETYLNSPQDSRRITLARQIQDDKINKIITRKELVIDSVSMKKDLPYSIEDVKIFQDDQEKIRSEYLGKQSRGKKRSHDEEDAIEENQEGGSFENEKREKEKLVDFLKKSQEKKKKKDEEYALKLKERQKNQKDKDETSTDKKNDKNSKKKKK